MTFQN